VGENSLGSLGWANSAVWFPGFGNEDAQKRLWEE
jgi:hypothetical protein